MPICSHSLFLPDLATLIYFVSIDLPILDILCKWDDTVTFIYHVFKYLVISILAWNNPSYGYAILCLYVYQLVDLWVDPSFLAIVTNATVNIFCAVFCGCVFSFLFGKYLEVELMDYIVTMFTVLRNFPDCFPEGMDCFIFLVAVYDGLREP